MLSFGRFQSSLPLILFCLKSQNIQILPSKIVGYVCWNSSENFVHNILLEIPSSVWNWNCQTKEAGAIHTEELLVYVF